MSGHEDLRALLTGFRMSAALSVAAELGLSDLLVGAPRTADDLATAVSADRDTLHRLLRALATVGVYELRADGAYANTPLGDLLRSDVPGSLRPLARTLQDPALWAAWGGLRHSVVTGENAFESVHGVDLWTYRQSAPEHNAVFNANMAAQTALVGEAVADAYDFSAVTRAVDVGGGHGALLEALLSRYPHLVGTVFDQPHALPQAPSSLEPAAAARWSAVAGSFFDSVPAADAYLLKYILHDWPDEQCVQILTTCLQNLDGDGVVLVVEALLDRPGHEAQVAFSDLNMLVLPGGRERTQQEYAELFDAAGLELSAVLHLAGALSVLEARARPDSRPDARPDAGSTGR